MKSEARKAMAAVAQAVIKVEQAEAKVSKAIAAGAMSAEQRESALYPLKVMLSVITEVSGGEAQAEAH